MRYTVYDNDFKIEYEIGDCLYNHESKRYWLIVEILNNGIHMVDEYMFSRRVKNKLIESGRLISVLHEDLLPLKLVNFETLKILYGQKT